MARDRYFDDKIITKLNEVFIHGYGWKTPMELQAMREEINKTRSWDQTEEQKKELKKLFVHSEAVEFYNVHYIEYHKFPDGTAAIGEGNADIPAFQYKEMEQRSYFIRRDTNHVYASGRPKRDCLGYVTVTGSREALRLAMKIFRLKYGEENGKLFFSTSW